MSLDDIVSANFEVISGIFKKFVEERPLVGAISLVSDDGVVIHSYPKDESGELDLKLGGMVSAVSAAAPTIVSELDCNRLFSMVVLADRGGILFYQLDDKIFLAVKLAKPGKIGQLFGDCQALIKQLKSLPS
ncbi:MAG: roadblock/LC7 domain-containing protein [Deltaproteobacteria bacterium]|nr:roadblock/LC7 domain-containing protein [Deltaproteobacteria bacterium]